MLQPFQFLTNASTHRCRPEIWQKMASKSEKNSREEANSSWIIQIDYFIYSDETPIASDVIEKKSRVNTCFYRVTRARLPFNHRATNTSHFAHTSSTYTSAHVHTYTPIQRSNRSIKYCCFYKTIRACMCNGDVTYVHQYLRNTVDCKPSNLYFLFPIFFFFHSWMGFINV